MTKVELVLQGHDEERDATLLAMAESFGGTELYGGYSFVHDLRDTTYEFPTRAAAAKFRNAANEIIGEAA